MRLKRQRVESALGSCECEIRDAHEILTFSWCDGAEVLKHFTMDFCLSARFDKVEEPLFGCYKK
jgi:hypothetical protein